MAVRRMLLILMAITAVGGWAAIELMIGIVELVINLARLI